MNIFYYQKKINSITAEKRKRAACTSHVCEQEGNLLHTFPLIENAARNTCTCSRETASWK